MSRVHNELVFIAEKWVFVGAFKFFTSHTQCKNQPPPVPYLQKLKHSLALDIYQSVLKTGYHSFIFDN